MNTPIAVFDSGVGSYSIVRVLRKKLPNERIVYLADRANFPYGNKTHDELKEIIDRTISWLEKNYQPKLIIVASNTPSIQVLDEIKSGHSTKLIGVFPPIEHATASSKTKHIAILATKGAVMSSEIDDYIKSKNLPKNVILHKINASDLVELVEPRTFQNDKQKTEKIIKSVIDPILAKNHLIDVMTLSSTHLPFLYDYFISLYPRIKFLDPANAIVLETTQILLAGNKLSTSTGSLEVIATVDESARLSLIDFESIMKTLGLRTKIDLVTI